MALLKRFVLLDDPGKPLLATDEERSQCNPLRGRRRAFELRFGATEVHDNLAFIPVTVPQAGGQPGVDEDGQSARFGLVREDGKWKLLSLGLLLLDVPSLARQWVREDLEAHQNPCGAICARFPMRSTTICRPTATCAMLSQLGPPSADDHGMSPDKAGFLDADLANGEDSGYRFRYNILAKPGGGADSTETTSDGFQLAATPIEYGQGGQRSFLPGLQRNAASG